MFEVAGSLLLLIVLEIVLGIDNLVFIAILADRLPSAQRARARRVGLALALIARIVLLATIDAISELTQPLFFVLGRGVSGRDLILFIGGFFLLYKAVHGIHEQVEGPPEGQKPKAGVAVSFRTVITQIVLLDIVFSIDSVITAVGTVDQIWVMVVAVVVAIVIMLVVAGTIADFVNRHPSVKTLALGFLLMIGMSLVADSVGFHIPKGYIYSAMAFAVLIEAIDLIAGYRRQAARSAPEPERSRSR